MRPRHLFLAAALAFVGPGAAPDPAFAQEATSPGEAVGQVFDALHLRTAPTPAPDFVRDSRPAGDNLDYEPLTRHEPERAARKKTPREMEALGAELESAGAQARQRATHVAVPDTGKAAHAAKKKQRPEN